MNQEDTAVVECELITGEKKIVPRNKLTFRPAVYALVYDAPKLLLVNTKSTGKWFFPGGAIERGEKAEKALRREVKEETGAELSDVSFFSFKESFFYYEPHDTGYHCLNLLFIAKPKNEGSSLRENRDSSDEADKYEWVDIHTIQPADMQSFAGEILERFRTHLLA
jgi:8-oxo-dGTP diphosphatase